jgi:tetratricopeptide (TPR) repeat protein
VREELETSGELEDVRNRCALFYLAFVEEAAPKLLGRDQLAWLQRIDAELDHLRAVFGWCRAGEIGGEVGLRLAGALVMYWELRGFAIEGHDWVTAMLALPEASARTLGRARALYSAAFLVAMRGDFAAQLTFAQESASIFQEAGHGLEAGRAVAEQAVAEMRIGSTVVARALLEQSVIVARNHGDPWGLSFALGQLGAVAFQVDDFAAARQFRAEAAAVARANGDRHTLGLAVAGLALLARLQGDLDESAMLFNEALRVSSELKDQWIMPRALGGLAGAAVLSGSYVRAARLFGATAAMRDVSGIGEAARPFRNVFERDEEETRTALGDEAFVAAWVDGRSMTLEQAVAYALDEQPSA